MQIPVISDDTTKTVRVFDFGTTETILKNHNLQFDQM